MGDTSTPSERVFLGLDRPAVEASGELLWRRWGGPRDGDLSGLLVVVPGARAGRLLSAVLAGLSRGSAMVPPSVITPGRLPGERLPIGSSLAGPAVCRSAWIEALRGAGRLGSLVPHPPNNDDVSAWSAMARLMERWSTELAGSLLTFGDVVERADSLDLPLDAGRWRVADDVFARYEALLARWGFEDPDQSARRAATAGEFDDPRDVVLVGVPELNAMGRACAHGCVSLVYAPEEWGDRFDAFGCVDADAWTACPIEIDDASIVFESTPTEQAEAVFGAIARSGGRFASHEVVVGVGDESLAARVERTASLLGVPVRASAGVPLAKTGPLRMLDAVADHLEDRRFDSLAALARQTDMERALIERLEPPGRVESWLDAFDDYATEHLPIGVPETWLGDDEERNQTLEQVTRATGDLLGGLLDADGRRPLAEWAPAVRGLMTAVFGGREWNPHVPTHRRVIDACDAIAKTLIECASCAHTAVTPGEALRLIGELAGAGASPQDPSRDAVELLGWLELPMDPSPRLVVCGVNEGSVPGEVAHDPLIPESLRTALGMPGESARIARDAYLLSVIAGDSREATFIAGRRSVDDDPLQPSRLLLRCAGTTLATRLRRFLGDEPQLLPPVRAQRKTPTVGVGFPVRPVVAIEPIRSMSVTSFKRYLSSPYGFYLERVLGLGEVDAGGVELDSMRFGNLLHHAIERFGRSEARDSTDPHEVEAALNHALEGVIARWYGQTPRRALLLQARFARLRLGEFARWQSQRRAAGWRIIEQEWRPESGGVPFDVDGEPIELRGRIDRVERRDETGELAIIDFKTGEKAIDADDHRTKRSREWVDLQLPLYRHLAAELGADDATRLAIVSLPRASLGVGESVGGWTPEELGEADEAARGVVRKIRDGVFGDPGRVWGDEGALAELCGAGFVGLSREQEGGAP